MTATDLSYEAKVAHRTASDLLPQLQVTVQQIGHDYRLTAPGPDGVTVEATYDKFADGAGIRADAQKFVRAVIKAHQKAGVPFAHTKRQTRHGLWVRVESVDTTDSKQALEVAEQYVRLLGFQSTRVRLIDTERAADRAMVVRYSLG